jgi:hypothetical protein
VLQNLYPQKNSQADFFSVLNLATKLIFFRPAKIQSFCSKMQKKNTKEMSPQLEFEQF